MLNFFRNLEISSTSFWLGFLSGILFAWILSRLRIYIPSLINALRKQVGGVRESFSISSEDRLRNDVYHFTQKQHLASNMFSLDEIAVVPKVLTPLIRASQSVDSAPTDSVSLSVPYIPDWPEMAAVYNASTMTLTAAIQGGANIMLAGHPGSGKTVALAWLASIIARNNPGIGTLSGLLPLYTHATDILHLLHHFEGAKNPAGNEGNDKQVSNANDSGNRNLISDDVIDILIRSIATYSLPLTINRLPGIIQSALEKQRAILLIDRIDELPPHQAHAVTAYIRSLLNKYPRLRIIAAISYDNLAGLPALGFSLLGMAAWGDYERETFLSRWSRLWVNLIIPLDKNLPQRVNMHYLNSWLHVDNRMLKPLEYTLKVWAAYAGDILGKDGPSAIEAYIKRMTSNASDAQSGLEHFALQLLLNMAINSNIRESNRFLNAPVLEPSPAVSELPKETENSNRPEPISNSQVKDIPDIDNIIDNGFLITYPGSHYGFSHQVLQGYLAGNALSTLESLDQLKQLPSWTLKTLAMYYFARNGDVTPLINHLIQEDDILHTNHLLVSRWLEIAPKNRPWRTIILRTLTKTLQKEKETISLAAKIISAMAFSGDSGVSIYFRQLLQSDHSNLRQLAALGCGIVAEKKAIADLNSLLQEQSPGLRRVASLALAAIGDKQSLEILASNLLNGDEYLRRCAAEALANDPLEGHPALKEGSSMEDLMVRRAVVFGLIRVGLPWATKIVENLQLEDNEWVVRNAAMQAFDELKRKSDYAPKPMTDPTEIPWLINYATKIGTNVAPGKPADELVLKALATGDREEIINALHYLREKFDTKTIEYIYAAYTNNTGEIRDLAYYMLWLMLISGVKISLTVKYNLQ